MNSSSHAAVGRPPSIVDPSPSRNGSPLAAVSSPPPRTVFGAPLHNHVDFVGPALDSLLAQTRRDFALVLVDDRSDDGTDAVARAYCERDPRVFYQRNPTRLGLVGNWRRCFELARELYPEAEYFAWASDHDLWHPHWLETLCRELDANPEVVLTYPVAQRITADGQVVRQRGGFETLGMSCAATRVRQGCSRMHAGDMVYGLVRVRSLARAGTFRRVLEPDRLLMAELAVQGQFRHVPQALWQRRFDNTAMRARQRRAIFHRRRPVYSWLWPWLVRPAVFAWVYGVRGAGRPAIGRLRGLSLAVSYSLGSLGHVLHRRGARLHKSYQRARKRLARARKRVRHGVGPVGSALRTLRRGPRRLARRTRMAAGRLAGRGTDDETVEPPAEERVRAAG